MDPRPHEQIIAEAAGGASVPVLGAFAARIGAKPHQPRDWYGRKSIPPEWWGVLVDGGWTTLDELQRAAEAKRLPEIAERRAGEAAA